MSYQEYSHLMISELERTIQKLIHENIPDDYHGVKEMMIYHLGWSENNASQINQGKRIRPLLVLLSTALFYEDWKKALPAAASVELLHNFSLIHDDIEDNSELRRGRETVWKVWGVPQAINTGDAMFSLSQLSMTGLDEYLPPQVSLKAVKLFNQTCIKLTGGQYLDMDFENRKVVQPETYYKMITGKTASLLSASVELGAMIAQTSTNNQKHLRNYGLNLGLAFQVWDDWLGVWGEEKNTGKSVASDLISGKKTMPILYALAQNQYFTNYLKQEGFSRTTKNLQKMVECLELDGAKEYTENLARQLTKDAIFAIESLENPDPEIISVFFDLTNSLLERKN